MAAKQKDFGAEDEVDLEDVFFMFAEVEKEGGEPVMSRQKITVALKALGIGDEMKAEDVLKAMDADNSGDIDLGEWTGCMTKELRRAIYAKLNNKDKLAGFRPLVDMAKLFEQIDADGSGSLSKDEIKSAMACLGLKAWDLDKMFETMDVNSDGEVSLDEFKAHLKSPANKYVFQAMLKKLNDQGLISGL